MANIKDLILSIESADSSFDEKLAAINKMEETLVAMRQQEEQAVQDNVDLIVEAIKLMEKKVTDQLEIAKSIVPEKGDKGDKGDRGADGKSGRDGVDGRDGKDGRDGVDGADGVSVTDAKIDFDGSLVITLSTGREINVGEVVAPDLAEKIKVITTMSTNGAVVIKDEGTTVSGGVKSINFVGASVTATNSGDDVTVSVAGSVYDPTNVAITGGNINGTTIGGTTPAAGTFTTLTATGQATIGSGLARSIVAAGSAAGSPGIYSTGSSLIFSGSASAGTGFYSNLFGQLQFNVPHTASAVNYVQVTGAATGGSPTISSQGSDANPDLTYNAKGTGRHFFQANGNILFQIIGGAGFANRLRVQSSAAGSAPILDAVGSDTNIDITLTPKGTGQTNIGTNFANYFALSGAATTKTVEAKALGSDTNIAFTIDSKGTGAVNLAAGSSGVNISNGGTVTAITRTAGGSGYTSIPSVVITAPTTAGGVQATATVAMSLSSAVVSTGGSGYTVNDVLTVSGGTASTAAQITVNTVSAGVITAVTITNAGAYTVLPSSPVSVTGGTGTGATFTVTWAVWNSTSAFTITNAGSGYVEQPTVSFSGGGGSAAAAYATVGGTAVIKGIGQTGIAAIDFFTAQSISASVPAMRIRDNVSDSYPMINNTTSQANFVSQGNTNANFGISAAGTGSVKFHTSGTSLTLQMQVSHTASAVNYVQVTGAATGGRPTISVQGSDSSINFDIAGKGFSRTFMLANGARQAEFTYGNQSAGVNGNHVRMFGNASGTAPVYSVEGSDTNIDLALTPKGTGRVQFGTYTATVSTIAGYIEIKDSGGTVRRLAVVS